MSDLDLACFDELFHLVHDHKPFVWQQQLAARALEGVWPDAVDVPTGMGKTAVIDIAVFCLAAQADRPPTERTAPMRTFVVVDRRIIVDQAFLRAERLRAALKPERDDVAGEVARRLCRLSVGTAEQEPLAVVRMRGGTTWASGWLRSPAQPAVVCGTVDQIGSRLLFRGYGVGTHRRPIDAALAGTDRLLFLDEAHLSLPFVRTSQSVAVEEAGAEQPILAARRSRPILLSATPPLGAAAPTEVFRADMEADTSDAARARLGVTRLVRLVEVKGKDDDAFVEAIAAVATAQVSAGATRTLVVVNTVALARHVHEHLVSQAPDADLALLIGRCRPFDRERISCEWLAEGGRLSAERPRHDGDRPAIAVATQTVEVGADIDVDALVTEACPLDSLLQRLGRLDRRGELGTSDAVVVHQEARHGEDAAVYRAALPRTWAWLCTHAGAPSAAAPGKVVPTLDAAPSIDLGPRGIGGLLSPAERSALAADPPLAPVALGAQLAAWARTDPAPSPDQDVAPFLHGIDHGQPQVQVVWRAWAALETAEGRSADLAMAPVVAHESVAISIGNARRFLAGADPILGSDVEGDEAEALDPFDEDTELKAWLVDPEGEIGDATATRIRPGSTLVLDVGAGGHDDWGWTGKRGGAAVVDVADLGTSSSRGGASLRLRDAVLRPLLGGETEEVCGGGDDDPKDLLRIAHAATRRAIEAAEHQPGQSDVRLHLLRALLQRCEDLDVADLRRHDLGGGANFIDPTGGDAAVALVTGKARRSAVGDAGPDGATSGASPPIGLHRHLRDVEARAGAVASALGLDDRLVQAVALAGLAHDLGKADRRFQAMLHGGHALRADAWGEPLAKSGMDPADRATFRRARQRSGWPSGMRHEAISAAIVERLLEEQLAPDDVDADLVRHLVVTHHGRGRPLLPPVTDDAPVEVEVALPGGGAAVVVRSDDLLVDWHGPSRFARLGRRYGWWGLALLEAVVRLADQAVSAEYATEPAARALAGADR